MPRTIQCKQCEAVLNLPPTIAAGKRLKCPRCGLKFVVSQRDASSESTFPGMADAASSNFEVPRSPHQRSPHDLDDLPIPRADRDLRETFDLPLLSGRELERGTVASVPGASDAASLFRDDPPRRKKTTAAEARRSARRCTRCGGVVPQGMSICMSCGTDQETGLRVGFEDEFAPPPPPPPSGPPFHVLMVGGLCLAGGIVLAIMSVAQSVHSESQLANLSWLALGLVSLFGIFAAVEFLRGKSARLMLTAIAIGCIVDVMGMIALPIIQASFDEPEHILAPAHSADIDDEDTAIRPLEERIDSRKLAAGVALLAIGGVLSIYMLSPTVKKYIHSRVARDEGYLS